MKTLWLLLVLIVSGCMAAEASQIDAGVSNGAYVEGQFKWYHDKYYLVCLESSAGWNGRVDAECIAKCNKDFKEIKKVLIRAIRDGKEKDFADMMCSYYGCKE